MYCKCANTFRSLKFINLKNSNIALFSLEIIFINYLHWVLIVLNPFFWQIKILHFVTFFVADVLNQSIFCVINNEISGLDISLWIENIYQSTWTASQQCYYIYCFSPLLKTVLDDTVPHYILTFNFFLNFIQIQNVTCIGKPKNRCF